MKNSVIFDMDGVLVNNSAVHTEAFLIFCARHGIDIRPEELQGYFGKGNDEILPGVMKRNDMTSEEIARYADEKEAIYREIFADRIVLVKGLLPLLEQLKARGVKLAVGSSGPTANVNLVLEKTGIARFFDAVADGDMIRRAKPDPEVFLLAARKLNSRPEECLVFEDSFSGRDAARAAGMNVVGLATTYKRETMTGFDLVIDDFSQIDGSIVERF